MDNAYQPPQVDLEAAESRPPCYVGFWARAGASIIDTILLLLLCMPVIYLITEGAYFTAPETLSPWLDFVVNYLLPGLVVVLFWVYRSATPGKMLVHAKIIDAKSGNKASTGQLLGRYLAYYLSAIPLCLGFFWVAWDGRKQGWHDKLAGTLVVRDDVR